MRVARRRGGFQPLGVDARGLRDQCTPRRAPAASVPRSRDRFPRKTRGSPTPRAIRSATATSAVEPRRRPWDTSRRESSAAASGRQAAMPRTIGPTIDTAARVSASAAARRGAPACPSSASTTDRAYALAPTANAEASSTTAAAANSGARRAIAAEAQPGQRCGCTSRLSAAWVTISGVIRLVRSRNRPAARDRRSG